MRERTPHCAIRSQARIGETSGLHRIKLANGNQMTLSRDDHVFRETTGNADAIHGKHLDRAHVLQA